MAKIELKYRIVLRVGKHLVGTKPFVLNTFGNVCYALLSELKGMKGKIERNPEIKMEYIPNTESPFNQQLKIWADDESVPLNPFTEEMIYKTILGYLGSLKLEEVSEDLSREKFSIIIKKREK